MIHKLRSNSVLIFRLSISLFVVVHLFFINLPPCSIHVWRQCNTLSVARNFQEESVNIFQPRVDRRYESNGVTGMQFPLYEWLLSFLFRLFEDGYWMHRLFSLLISITGIYFSYLFISRIANDKLIGLLCASCIMWSPEFFYHSINALPDILALSLAFISLYFFSGWMKNLNTQNFIYSMIFVGLSGLVKIQYLMIGGFMLGVIIYFFRTNNKLKDQFSLLFVGGTLPVFVTLWWYIYAAGLIKSSGLFDFGIEFRPAESFSDALSILNRNIISDWPELVFGYANTLVVLIAIFFLFAKRFKHSEYTLGFILLSVLYIAYHLIELRQMQVHQYYMLPSLIILSGLIAFASKNLLNTKFYWILLLVLFAQPILASIRIIPARWAKTDLGIPAEFSNSDSRIKLSNAIPNSVSVIAGPDVSGCIYLYFLHKKGFGFEYEGQLSTKISNNEILLEQYIQRGARYLYTDNEATLKDSLLIPHFEKEILKEGNFHLIQLKDPTNNLY
jgi:hypothetical protein